jgi:hypothetical protein
MSGSIHPSRLCAAVLALSVSLLAAPGDARASDLTGRTIMEFVDARDDGDNAIADQQMILIDKRGKQRKRTIRAFSKDQGADEYVLIYFLSPADVKDTGMLTYDYDDPEKDDDQWLYLPALKKVKRIASSKKNGSFMGSDFSYADMTSRPLEHYEYTLMKEGEVNGVNVWQIEAIPNNEDEISETGYSKSVLFVRQDNYVVIRAVHWVKDGARLKYMDVKKLEKIDGIWVPTEMHMTTKKGKTTLHKTILTATDVRFNQALDEQHFTTRQLEKGM